MAKVSRTLTQAKLIAEKEAMVSKAKVAHLEATDKYKTAQDELKAAKAKRG